MKHSINNEFVINNFQRLRNDYGFYSENNLFITSKRGRLIPFKFNRMQRYLAKVIKQDIEKNEPVRLVILKARQLGSTTFAAGLLYWLTSLQKDKNALIVSHDLNSSYNIGGKIRNFYLRSHPLLKPNCGKMNRSEIHFCNTPEQIAATNDYGLDSRLLISTADNPALGRSYTFQYALLSEFALWEDLAIDVSDRMSALNQAIPDDPGTIIIAESTAKGEGYFKNFYEDDKNGYRKVFVSWVADDEYNLNIDGEAINLCEAEDSTEEEGKYGDEVSEKDFIDRELKIWYPETAFNKVWLHKEAMKRIQWRRRTIDRKTEGDRRKFRQEYPTTPSHAFLATSTCVFDTVRLSEISAAIKDNNIKASRYRYLHDINNKDPKRTFYAAKYGPLRIYEEPQPNSRYVIGGDVAQGIEGGDSSSVVVLKVPELVEVAAYNEIVSPDHYAGICNALGRLYNNALMGIESNDKGGYAALLELHTRYYYPTLYFQKDLITKKHSGFKYGWKTNQVTKQVLITDTNSLINNGAIYIKSNELVSQLRTYVELPNGKIGALPGKHDDFVMALMISVQMAKQTHIPVDIPQQVYEGWTLNHWVKLAEKPKEERGFRRA